MNREELWKMVAERNPELLGDAEGYLRLKLCEVRDLFEMAWSVASHEKLVGDGLAERFHGGPPTIFYEIYYLEQGIDPRPRWMRHTRALTNREKVPRIVQGLYRRGAKRVMLYEVHL